MGRSAENQGSPLALYAQIKESLRKDIAAGRLAPLDQLPSESELMAEFGVSRITVRQALSDLQTEGLIYKHHGKGSFVAQPKAEHPLDRLQGFAEAMRVAGAKITNEVLSLMELPASATVAERLAVQPGEKVTEIRRLRYLDSVPTSYDVTYVPLDIGRALAKADLVTRDIFVIIESDLGIPLGNAELGIEATSADKETARLFGIKRNAPLLRLERLTFSRDRKPIDFEYIVYRGDGFRYRLTIERGGTDTQSA